MQRSQCILIWIADRKTNNCLYHATNALIRTTSLLTVMYLLQASLVTASYRSHFYSGSLNKNFPLLFFGNLLNVPVIIAIWSTKQRHNHIVLSTTHLSLRLHLILQSLQRKKMVGKAKKHILISHGGLRNYYRSLSTPPGFFS